MEFYFPDDRTPDILADGGVVFAGGVYVLVAEHVCHDVYIPRGPVEGGAVCAAQLMGGYLFERRDYLCVLLYKIFNRAHGYAPLLGGQKKGVFGSGGEIGLFFVVQISLNCPGHVVIKEEYGFSAALARYDKGIVIEVDILVVEADKFADSYARAEEEYYYCAVAYFIALMECPLVRRQPVTRFGNVYNVEYLVAVKADYGFFVQFRRRYLGGIIDGNEAAVEKIFEHRAHGRKFSGLCSVVANMFLALIGIMGKVGEEHFNIVVGDALQIRERKLLGGSVGAEAARHQKMKKYFEVVGVIHACERGRLTVDSKEVVAAKIRKFVTQEVIDDLNIFIVALGIKVGCVFCSSQSNASNKK